MKIPFVSSKANQRVDTTSSNSASFNKTNAVARLCALYFGAQSCVSGVKDVKDMYAKRKEITDLNGTVTTPAYTKKQQLQKGAIAASKIAAGALVAYKAVK